MLVAQRPRERHAHFVNDALYRRLPFSARPSISIVRIVAIFAPLSGVGLSLIGKRPILRRCRFALDGQTLIAGCRWRFLLCRCGLIGMHIGIRVDRHVCSLAGDDFPIIGSIFLGGRHSHGI
jgi:hypothetical protein